MPALLGCQADGPTREDALRNLDTVADLWIEKALKMGRQVREPERELFAA